MNRRSWLQLGLTGLVSVITGCGFRPRGSITELADPGAVFIDVSRGVTLRAELQAALRERSFSLAENRDVADILLRISEEQQNERIISIQSSGVVSEIELSHSVAMQLAQRRLDEPPAYNPNQPANRVEVIREYTNDILQVLGKEQEAQILREEMREELVRQVVLRAVATLVDRS